MPRGRELLYGRNGVLEALRGRRRVHAVTLAAGARDDARLREIAELASRLGVRLAREPGERLNERLPGVNHQGVVAECDRYPYARLEMDDLGPGPVLALDHLQDPQNVGTLLRAALAFGVEWVLIPEDRAAEITPAVVNSSAGAVERLRVARVVNLARTLAEMKERGRWVVGLDTGEDAVPIWGTALPTPAVVVVGAEGPGLAPLVHRTCDLIVSIPMTGAFDSLNAATAGSIALYELARQTQVASPTSSTPATPT